LTSLFLIVDRWWRLLGFGTVVKGICFVIILASTQCDERETSDAHLVLFGCIHVEVIMSSIVIIVVSSRGGTVVMGSPEVNRLLDKVDHSVFLEKCFERIVAASFIVWICWALFRFREKYLWPSHCTISFYRIRWKASPTPSIQIAKLSACQCDAYQYVWMLRPTVAGMVYWNTVPNRRLSWAEEASEPQACTPERKRNIRRPVVSLESTRDHCKHSEYSSVNKNASKT
jgi:hypothetical protein